jgi:hypothetical protein
MCCIIQMQLHFGDKQTSMHAAEEAKAYSSSGGCF